MLCTFPHLLFIPASFSNMLLCALVHDLQRTWKIEMKQSSAPPEVCVTPLTHFTASIYPGKSVSQHPASFLSAWFLQSSDLPDVRCSRSRVQSTSGHLETDSLTISPPEGRRCDGTSHPDIFNRMSNPPSLEESGMTGQLEYRETKQ